MYCNSTVSTKQVVVSIQVEIGRYLGKECLLCDEECESVCHVLREFLVYSSLRNDVVTKYSST